MSKEYLASASKSYGGGKERALEKYIMDFEIHGILCKSLATYVRGGMAVPFHAGSATRLSEDIDMYVTDTMDDVERRMGNIHSAQDAYGIEIRRHKPRGGGLPLPLLTYRIKYESVLGGTDEVKADLLCDPMLSGLPHKEFSIMTKLGQFHACHAVAVLDAGTLVADKITALSAGTIGYGANQLHKMNKQVYDVGQLLRRLPRSQIEQTVTQYGPLALRKSGYAQEYGKRSVCDPGDVAKGACDALLAMLMPKGRFEANDEFKGNFARFKGTYLGNSKYSLSAHRSDALLAVLLASVLLEHEQGRMGADNAVGAIGDAAATLKLLEDPATSKPTAEKIEQTTVDNKPLRQAIRHLPPDQQSLIGVISHACPGILP